VLRREDVPAELLSAFLSGLGGVDAEDEWLLEGGSGIVSPGGEWLVGPVVREATTLVASLDLADRDARSHDLDVAGHYARSDVLRLSVDRRRLGSGVSFTGDSDPCLGA
jgi:nitrilase